ncbi:MAG TPA: hypothetical protein VK899_00510, partial [Gemmatimonadales bacterium]|nr:hypothetical protein [Gemmatimonadales bacterium]
MDYQDFTIEIRSAGANLFEATVIEAPRRAKARSVFPEPLSRGELELLSSDKTGASSSPSQPREVGTRLYAALFQTEIDRLFQSCRDSLQHGDQGLRLRLRIGADDLQAEYLSQLPWEWLWDPWQKAFLSVDLSTPVVRDFAVGIGNNPLLAEPPLRILVVDSSPVTESFL